MPCCQGNPDNSRRELSTQSTSLPLGTRPGQRLRRCWRRCWACLALISALSRRCSVEGF
jgi:hypothetical protein